MAVLERLRVIIRALQTSMMVLLTKIVGNVNLIKLTILAKRLILDAWPGPGCSCADGYITVLKIRMKICKDGRQVKKESHFVLVFLFLSISIWSLSHKPTIKKNYQMYLSSAVLKLFVRKFYANYYQTESIFSKILCSQHILLNSFRRMCLNYENCSLRRILF